MLLCSCSTTSRIPEGEYLYTGLDGIKYSERLPKDLKEVLYTTVDVPATEKMLYFLPVGLWVYNHWEDTDSTPKFKRWLYRKLVKEPVLVSDVRPALRVKLLDEILDNNGYFSGSASYELIHPRNKRKAGIRYTIDPGPAYLIDSIIYLPDTCYLNHVIDSMAMRDPYLKKGVRFCLDSLNTVRTRISNRVRNRGFYYFRPEYIQYLADSLIHRDRIALRIDIADNMDDMGLQRYRTGDVTVHVNRYRGRGRYDTIQLKNLTLIQQVPSRLRKGTISDNVMVRPGKYLNMRDINNTQNYLSRLGIFKDIDIVTSVVPDAKQPTVDVNIATSFDMPLEASIEVNASSKSNSYIGPGMKFGVTNYNIFGGGEQLSVNLTGTYEWQTGHDRRSVFNSYEFGLNASLSFPRLLFPKFIPRRRRQINWTRINLGGELLNRPHYFKMAQFNTGISYDWNSTRRITNSFTPLKLTYTKLLTTTYDFDSIMAANPAVALSFQNQFVPQMSYTFTYEKKPSRLHTFNWTFTLQEAGNVFWAAYQLAGAKGEKKLFGTPFSQFVKGSTQVVFGRKVLWTNWLVTRLAIGAAHAYGNSSQVPYAEQFYCGGANSVRAFTVRSIGPGSFHQKGSNNDYFDQTGTFKFEANVELRFPLYSILNGAVFLDAGNVWLLKNDPLRPGGKLEMRNFFKELATGTGFGVRADIGMLVLRADLGIGIHAPYDTGKSGYYNMTSFKSSLAFHLAIGYPF